MATARSLVGAGGAVVELCCSERTDGDFAVGGDPATLAERRSALVDLPWTWLDQVHGDGVVVVDAPGGGCGVPAAATVTTVAGAVLAVHTADCAPVLLWSTDGAPAVGAAHAGWRGLYAGVLEATVAELRRRGARRLSWALGPHIGPIAYEFSPADLTTMALRFGPEVVSATAEGRPAFDLGAAVRAALAAADVDPAEGSVLGGCTATAVDHAGTPRWYSHRARGDRGRQASLVWLAP